MSQLAIVIDNGTSLTQMYAGNINPDFVIPTSTLADLEKKNISYGVEKNYEYIYFTGDEAIIKFGESIKHKLKYPIQK